MTLSATIPLTKAPSLYLVPKVKYAVGFEYDRAVPEAWERSLWTIAPPSNFVSWLKITWWAGDVWEPVQRYGIWQMRHPKFIKNRPDLIAELRGPSPRAAGHYCADGHCKCRMKLNAWRCCANRGSLTCKQAKHPHQIDYAQWKLFQETGHYGTRWWCIQGEHGGHRHRLTPIEAKVSRLNKGPSDTPAPGDLPFAEYDQRTFHKVAQLDRVRMWKGVAEYAERNHATMDAEEQAEATQARTALWHWLESQVKQTVDKIGRSGALALKEAAPRVLGKQAPLNEDAIQEDFIHGE
jgi:hypothetical protein